MGTVAAINKLLIRFKLPRGLYYLCRTTTKVNVNITTTNVRGKQGMDFYFHAYVLAVVQAKHIPVIGVTNVVTQMTLGFRRPLKTV